MSMILDNDFLAVLDELHTRGRRNRGDDMKLFMNASLAFWRDIVAAVRERNEAFNAVRVAVSILSGSPGEAVTAVELDRRIRAAIDILQRYSGGAGSVYDGSNENGTSNRQ